MHIAICVCTFKRPQGLRRLLEGLDRLTFETVEPPRIDVIVVDNEARGSAAAVCRDVKPTFRWTLVCTEEPRRGITYARNKCLDTVGADVDFIAFIDDDEVPDHGWLEELLLARSLHDADVVTGPVVPRFESGSPPRWVQHGRFFEPRRHPDGRRLAVAFTNNVLMRGAIPQEINRRFDDRFALTGGEDTDFFMHAHRAGYRIVWAARALVYETIPASRTTVGWLLRRNYREWGSHSRCELALYPSPRVLAMRVVKATTLIVAGLAYLPIAALLGRRRLVCALLLVSRGLGSYSGLLGRHYREYADVEAAASRAAASAKTTGL